MAVSYHPSSRISFGGLGEKEKFHPRSFQEQPGSMEVDHPSTGAYHGIGWDFLGMAFQLHFPSA